jgi:photosynthetic reaction center cytochrome c subunit
MRLGWRQATTGALGIAMICLAGAGLLGQTAPAAKQTTPAAKPAATAAKTGAPKQEMAGTYFKNVQVLKNIPVDEFMDTMGFFAASLSLNCTDCHVPDSAGSWAKYADDTQLKITSRKMVLMVNAINANNFGGAKFVTCWTCHRGGQQPSAIPSLLEQYSPPPPDDPNEYVVRDEGAAGTVTADQVFAKYIQAVGGAQKLAAVKSFTGKGTYEGYDTDHEPNPFEVYAKAPNMRATIVHFRIGEGIRVTDGRNAWIASSDKPQPVMTLTGGELDGAKTDAAAMFPLQLKALFPTWKVGETMIGDDDVYVLIGSAPGRPSVKLFFNKKTSLLVRHVRYDNTLVGTNPIQVDYTDYRDVNGVKMPFGWTLTWTDGQDIIKLTDIQQNAALSATQFNKPAPVKSEDTSAGGGQ